MCQVIYNMYLVIKEIQYGFIYGVNKAYLNVSLNIKGSFCSIEMRKEEKKYSRLT